MESLLIQPQKPESNFISAGAHRSAEAKVTSVVLEGLKDKQNEKTNKNSYEKIAESFSFTAQKVLEQLNTILAEYVPEGVESLKIAEHTPEKTADRIVSQVTGLFAAYEKQNQDKTADELVSGFMELARKGVNQGYSEAFEILEDIGAFKFNGVQGGVEETKRQIDEKLNAFETYLSEKLGVKKEAAPTEDDIQAPVKENLLAQGGAQLSVTA